MVVVLIAMVITQFAMYHELAERVRADEQLAQLKWKAQLEAFKVYSKAINEQSELVVRAVRRNCEDKK